MCKVVNKYKEPYDIYIGRGSPWGNPFSHKEGTKAQWKVDTREEAIDKFRQWLWQHIKLGNIKVEDILSLDGKTLGCFCKPQACHGDVLVKAVEYFRQKELLMK